MPADFFNANQKAEEFVARVNAAIRYGGEWACYIPATDEILLPLKETFIGTGTSTPTEAYYSTLFHELTHWTGHKSRCDRDLGKRFGPFAYAMEELIAELGAAFLCAELGIASKPRPDHAHYLRHWLTVLLNDRKALFTAASKASQAAAHLHGLASSALSANAPAEFPNSWRDFISI
jgi:antirestriction protein ArdC